MSAETLLIAAGGVTFAGNMAKAKSFPPNGVAIVAATVALVILASATKNTPLSGPVKALAGLMLLVAVYVNVPAFTKGKTNG